MTNHACFFRLFFCFLLLTCFQPEGAAQRKNKPIEVLIVDGYSNHDWQQTTRLIKWMLEETGRFDVSVSTAPTDTTAYSWAPDFSRYAVVIQNTNNIHNGKLRWPRAAEVKLEEYIRNGGGLYVLHSANNAFAHWKAYNKMIGMGWRPRSYGYALEIDSAQKVQRIPPGEGQGTGHGDRFDAIVQILTPHPINKGFPQIWKTANTEVYHFPRGSAENLTVLSYAFDSSATQRQWPLEWVVQYGKGRVYNSSMGHLWAGEKFPVSYRCIGFQTTVIRATEWLATGKVTYPVPKNFPTKSSTSLRNEADYKEGDL